MGKESKRTCEYLIISWPRVPKNTLFHTSNKRKKSTYIDFQLITQLNQKKTDSL